jgi:hypothetical protein
MEGLVTSYSGTTLIINIDTTGGSGTFASWNINAAGNVGATGATGASGPSTVSYTSNGSSVNLLQTLTTVSSASRAVNATTSNLTGLIGIASSTVSAGSAVLVNVYGTASCVFDGATTAGDYVQASATVAANCHDAGASYPTSNQVLGLVLSTNASGGTFTVFLYGLEIRGTSVAPVTSVFGRTGVVTAATNDYNFNQLAGSLASTQDYTVGSAGTYTKLTTNAQGRVSAGATAAASDLSNGTTGTGAIVLATSPAITTPSLSSPSLGTTAHTSTYTSNASTVNLLQVLTTVSSASRATNAGTSATSGVIGIAQSTVSAGTSVEVATSGKVTCQFDATAVTAGDYVQISSVTAGDCHDAGSTRPTSGQIIGFALSTGLASTTETVRLFDAEEVPAPVSVRHTLQYLFYNAGSVLVSSATAIGGFTVPAACTIASWDIDLSPSDTATVKTYKVATGTTHPTSTNSISTSGVSITTGGHVHSTILTDFTTTSAAAYDVFAFALTAVGGTATQLTFSLECD